jgi:hypothetical protein
VIFGYIRICAKLDWHSIGVVLLAFQGGVMVNVEWAEGRKVGDPIWAIPGRDGLFTEDEVDVFLDSEENVARYGQLIDEIHMDGKPEVSFRRFFLDKR